MNMTDTRHNIALVGRVVHYTPIKLLRLFMKYSLALNGHEDDFFSLFSVAPNRPIFLVFVIARPP